MDDPKRYNPNSMNLNGGRDRTRTCDLLRVKQLVWFWIASYCFQYFTGLKDAGKIERYAL